MLSWFSVFLWMGLIFWFSAQSGEKSSNMSGIFHELLLSILRIFSREQHIHQWKDVLHTIVRKCAHFSEYMILGILLYNALRRSGIPTKIQVPAAVLISALYAASDEIHQFFIPGRSAQLRDVMIDTAGAACGVLIFWLVLRWKKNKKQPFFKVPVEKK